MKSKSFVWFVMGLTTAVLTIPRINFAQVTILENRPQATRERLAAEAAPPWLKGPWYLIDPCLTGFEATNERVSGIDADSNDDLDTATSQLTKDVKVYSEVKVPGTDRYKYTDLLSLEPLCAGPDQPRSLYARFVVAADDNVKHMAEGRIECYDESGHLHSRISTTQNIWLKDSEITMVARMLFKPAVKGKYTCKTVARVAKCAKNETSCTHRYLVFKIGEGKTELIYSSPTWGMGWGTGTEWGPDKIAETPDDGTGNDSQHVGYEIDESGRIWPLGTHDRDHPDNCDRQYDDKLCTPYQPATHIHKGITVPTMDGVFVGDQEHVAKSSSFTIPDGPTTFNAYSGIHMTSCVEDDPYCSFPVPCFPAQPQPGPRFGGRYWGCDPWYVGAKGFGGEAKTTNSVVDLKIVATQLYANGTVCGVPNVGPTKRLTILGDSHHQTAHIIYNDIPIDPKCGSSRRFTVKTYVERVSGNPVRVEYGWGVGDGTSGGFTGFTHTGVYAN